MFDSVLRDTGSIVRNSNVGHAIGQCGTHLDTCFATPFERLGGIAHEVDEGKCQQMRVGIELHLGRSVELQFARSGLIA